MAQNLNADLNIIGQSDIEIQIDPLTKDLSIIAKLDDEPNDVGGLSAAELKAKFDEAGNVIKDFINNSLIPQALGDGVSEKQRQANETARQTNETARQTAEAGRVSAEAARGTAESDRASAEEARETAEAERDAAETARETAENSRGSAETARVSAEALRQSGEADRESAETARQGNETARQSAETARQAAESARASAEAARETAESARASAETARASAEEARETAESARASAEEAREARFSQEQTGREKRFSQEQADREARFSQEQADREERFSAAEAERNVWEDYDGAKAYAAGNKVYYLGSSYVCAVPCTGVLPTDGAHWQIIAEKGADGIGPDAVGLLIREHNEAEDAHPDMRNTLEKLEAGMSSTIRVTFPAGFAGRAYTATDGKETITGTIPEGLAADIHVKDLNSTYAIRAVIPDAGEYNAEARIGQYYGEYTAVTLSCTHIYGVEWDWTDSGPTRGTRLGAAAGFSDPAPAVNNGSGSSPFDGLMPWAGMVKETRTGGVMVKEPKYWFKWTKTGKKLKLQIADGPMDGFFVDPVNRDRGDGLGEVDFSYIGRYHCAGSNWKSETNAAQKHSIIRSDARSGIHGLGANIWQFDFAQFWYIGMLFLVEFADWNGQKCIGLGCSASDSMENNGKTDAMQYHTGTTAANRDTYGYTQYRNVEGYWDNVYDWMDGCYYNGNGLNVINNPNQYSDDANGTLVGKPVGGYPSDFAIPTQSGLEWALYPSAANGSQTTYVPDSWNFNGFAPCLRHGGGSSQGQDRGPFCVASNNASGTGGYIGCRLWERPPKA